MNTTASKLVASVQRAKNQSEDAAMNVVPAQEINVPSAEVIPSELVAKPSADTPTPRPRTTRASTLRTELPVAESVSSGAPKSNLDGDHNGAQPTFPQRVWPD